MFIFCLICCWLCFPNPRCSVSWPKARGDLRFAELYRLKGVAVLFTWGLVLLENKKLNVEGGSGGWHGWKHLIIKIEATSGEGDGQGDSGALTC